MPKLLSRNLSKNHPRLVDAHGNVRVNVERPRDAPQVSMGNELHAPIRRRPLGHHDSKSCQFPILSLPPTTLTALVARPVAGSTATAVAKIAKAPVLAGTLAIRALPRARNRHRLLGTVHVISSIKLDFDADVGHRIVRRRRWRSFAFLVVFPAIRLVADDFVGFGELFILRLGYLVPWVPIRMKRDGLLPEGSPDLVGSGVLLNAQDRVVVRFTGHRNILP